MQLLKFYYNAEDDGGGVADVQDLQQPQQNTEISTERLKDWGFESQEQLNEFFEKRKLEQIPEEEKKKQEELDELEFKKFAVEGGYAKTEDFDGFSKLSQKDKKELAFENFVKEFREDNQDIEDEDILDYAKEEFNREFKLDGYSEKQQQRGLAKLDKYVNEIIHPFSEKISKAKEEYDNFKTIKKEFPKFEEFISESVKNVASQKLNVVSFKVKNGEDINIDIELSDKDKEELYKNFATHKTFYKYNKDGESLKKELESKMKSWLWVNKKDEIIKSIVEKSVNVGVKNGSDIGARNPYPLSEANYNEGNDTRTLLSRIRESHSKIRI